MTEKMLFGMKVDVRDDLPPGEVRLIGHPRIVNGLEVRDCIRITGIEVGPEHDALNVADKED